MRKPEHNAIFMPGRGESEYIPSGRTDIVNDPEEVKTEVATDVVVSDTGTQDDS